MSEEEISYSPRFKGARGLQGFQLEVDFAFWSLSRWLPEGFRRYLLTSPHVWRGWKSESKGYGAMAEVRHPVGLSGRT
jgi:hypothetical protein